MLPHLQGRQHVCMALKRKDNPAAGLNLRRRGGVGMQLQVMH